MKKTTEQNPKFKSSTPAQAPKAKAAEKTTKAPTVTPSKSTKAKKPVKS